MKRWESWLLIVVLLTIGTLSLSQAQWNPDTTNFYPAKVVKEMFGVFEAIKVGTNLTASEKSGNSTVVRGGKFVASNIDNPDIDGGTVDDADINGADIDGADIDGGTIDGTTIGATVDIVEAEIRFDNRTSNPSGPSEGDAYWNSNIDSLRIYDGSKWRNVGQRGQGYYELTTYGEPRLQHTGGTWKVTSVTGDSRVYGSSSGLLGSSSFFNVRGLCVFIRGHGGAVSYSVETLSGSRHPSIYTIRTSPISGVYTSLRPQLTSSSSGIFQLSTSSNRIRTPITGYTCFDNYGTGFGG